MKKQITTHLQKTKVETLPRNQIWYKRWALVLVDINSCDSWSTRQIDMGTQSAPINCLGIVGKREFLHADNPPYLHVSFCLLFLTQTNCHLYNIRKVVDVSEENEQLSPLKS